MSGERILFVALEEDDEPSDNVIRSPDWTIEILSPDQAPNRVADNIVYCLKNDIGLTDMGVFLLGSHRGGPYCSVLDCQVLHDYLPIH